MVEQAPKEPTAEQAPKEPATEKDHSVKEPADIAFLVSEYQIDGNTVLPQEKIKGCFELSGTGNSI
jgi:hypothetical protein